MRGAVDLGHRILDQEHPIIMLDPAAYGRDTQTHVVTPATTQVVTPIVRKMVSSGVFAVPTEALLDHHVLTGPGLQRVKSLAPPRYPPR